MVSTAFLSLDAARSLPPSPAFLVPSPEPMGHVKRVIKTILKARRIAVVCGAGVSVEAGIPDFRSSEGLFRSMKKNHSTLVSGKDLFDASVFTSEDTTSLFYQMVARLWQLSETAKPTAFHCFLRALDDRRRLLRVYTQNIDALEEKSGLTFGVPGSDLKWSKPQSSTGEATRVHRGRADEASARQRLPPPVGIPKCIPLHGTLRLMHCMACAQSYPLCDYVDSLVSGTPPPCPECAALENTRRLIGKRARGVGKLRPGVVLYNEEHKSGEAIGDVVEKDLNGRADLLLVVGTSLHIPGTKRIVREFSKAVRSLHVTMNTHPDLPADGPTMDTRRQPRNDDDQPIRTIYVNLDFPMQAREWDGVFDVWVQGDAQVFARMVREELEKEAQAKEVAKERKRKREEHEEQDGRLKLRYGVTELENS